MTTSPGEKGRLPKSRSAVLSDGATVTVAVVISPSGTHAPLTSAKAELKV